MGYIIRFAAVVLGIMCVLFIILASIAYLLTKDPMWGWFVLMFIVGGLVMLGIFYDLKDYEL